MSVRAKSDKRLKGKRIIEFIAHYKEHECLWNTDHNSYKNMEEKNKCYEAMSEHFRMDVAIIKKKINNMRSSYSKHLAKIAISKEYSYTGREVYSPTVSWFKALDFLGHVVKPRSIRNLPTFIFKKSSDDDGDPDESDGPFYMDASSENSTLPNQQSRMQPLLSLHPSEGNTNTFKDNNLNTQNTITQPSVSSYGDGMNRTINVIPIKDIKLEDLIKSTSQSKDDEIDVFCKSIALQIKGLPPVEVIKLQLEIQTLVANRRLSLLADHN